ncbi:putative RNA-directed DNA polymerase from transposon X-element, partial [Trichonephila clavipes]
PYVALKNGRNYVAQQFSLSTFNRAINLNWVLERKTVCAQNSCEVRDFVLEQNLDLFLVQETKLEPGQDPLIANYHLYKDDRVIFPRIRTAGGTAIYCKSNFVHSRAPLPGIQYMDATAIEIKINNLPPLRVVSAYARFCAEINRKFLEKDFIKILNSAQLSTNWENFRFLLKHKPLPIPASPSNEHLDIAIGRLGENISEALVAASKPKFKTAPIKLPPDIRSKIRHRNRVRRFWQRSRDPALKKCELRTISNEIAKVISDTSPVQDGRKQFESYLPKQALFGGVPPFSKSLFHHIPPKGRSRQYRSCPN